MNPLPLRDHAADSHVLVVEDEERSRRLMRDLLEAHGYRISEAADGEEALRRIETQPPDLILLDIMLPKMDGIEVCRKLQADERNWPIPVLLVTALSDRAVRLRGIAAGATDFITKPVDTAEVLLRVRNALRTKHLYDQRNNLLRLREELSDMIVHDIRNPLLAISLCTRSLGDETPPSEVTRLAGIILDQTQAIERFVNDLLTISKMEQGCFTLQRTREDLSELGRAAFRNQQMIAASRKIQLILVAPDRPCIAEVDKSLLARLLDNLLSNAIKFAPADTCVTLRIISATDDAGTPCRLCVEDEGPGIPLGYREKVFDKFGVVEMKRLGIPQTGLGLALCRLVAEAHGGHISVEARQPRGSVFTVELPGSGTDVSA